MYQIGDQVLYGSHGVCCVTALEERTVDRKRVEYFVLEPLEQPGTKYYVPRHNQAAVAKLRRVMTVGELESLLCSDAVRQDAWIADEGQRKNRYRELISSGDRTALLCMVRTLYRRKSELAEQGKKFHLCDENFLRDAQRQLDGEFSLILNMSTVQVGEYIRSRLLQHHVSRVRTNEL